MNDDAPGNGSGGERDDAADGSPPPPLSVSEMVGRRVTVAVDGEERPATVLDGAYARNTGDVMVAVELDETPDRSPNEGADDLETEKAAGERLVVEEERVRFD